MISLMEAYEIVKKEDRKQIEEWKKEGIEGTTEVRLYSEWKNYWLFCNEDPTQWRLIDKYTGNISVNSACGILANSFGIFGDPDYTEDDANSFSEATVENAKPISEIFKEDNLKEAI